MYHVSADDIPLFSITDKCIVLDLDHTLVATQDDLESLKTLNILNDPTLLSLRNRVYYITIEDLEKRGVGTRYDFWGVSRPHVDEFLVFCFSYFKVVAVWSAGKRYYVENIVDYLFKDLPKPHVVFSYDDVVIGTGNHLEKPLSKMIESHPILQKFMSVENTFVIDDTLTTFSQNVDNGVLIPAYQPSPSINSLSRDDPTLLQLKYWLLQPEVANSEDVTSLDKESIFSTSLKGYSKKMKDSFGYYLK